MNVEIREFEERNIPEAGGLLARRHTRNRTALPLLPTRFEHPQAAIQAVDDLWRRKFRSGFAAFRDGKMIAYLIGEFVQQPWARSGYVQLPGYAVAESEDSSIIQDLYARIGDDWVKRGIFYHNLYISAADADISAAFFDLAFGKERVDGLLDLRTADIPEIENPSGIEIHVARRNNEEDKERIGVLSTVQVSNLSLAPYWHSTPPEAYSEMRDGWGDELLGDESTWTVWLALEKDNLLGMIGTRPETEDATNMLASPRAVYLSVASTLPAARERGIGTALAWECLRQARKDGFETCYINWNSPNFLASRFWPRFGFTEVSYRLSKQINPMILWAKE